MIAQTVFLLSSIFLVKPLYDLARLLFRVQFDWGYDPMKSKVPWVLWAFFILILIWLWVYFDVFSKLYKTPFNPVPSTPTSFSPSQIQVPSVMKKFGTTVKNGISGFFSKVYANTIKLYDRLYADKDSDIRGSVSTRSSLGMPDEYEDVGRESINTIRDSDIGSDGRGSIDGSRGSDGRGSIDGDGRSSSISSYRSRPDSSMSSYRSS